MNSSKLLLAILILLITFSVSYASDFRITGYELERDIFFPGDVVEGTITIENRRSETLQYKVELIYNNKVFSQGTPRFLYADETVEQNFFLEIPDKDGVWVTFRVYNEDSSTQIRRYIFISSRKRDFSFNLDRSIEMLKPGETETFNLNIYNRGTLDDIYKISIENWEHFDMGEDVIKLKHHSSEKISMSISAPEDIRVGNYEIDLFVCNLKGTCKTEKIEILINRPEREQSLIIFDTENFERTFSRTREEIEFDLYIENIGADEKRYTIFIEKDDTEKDIIINFNNPDFTLGVGKNKNVSFLLSPIEPTDYTVYLVVNAEGNRIYREKIELEYNPGLISITGMFFSGDAGSVGGMGLILSALMIIGIGGYFLFRHMQTNICKENAVDYTEKHPRKLTNNYPAKGGNVNGYDNKW